MPLYEYRCESCRHRFEALVHGGERPPCERCGSRKLEKLISAFAVSTTNDGGARTSAAPEPGCGSCGDPRGPGSCRLDD